MKVVVLRDIDLQSSNVPESEPVWSSGTTYNSGDIVYYDGADPHYVYESLTDSNTGNVPPDSPNDWLRIGTTNKWSMFDGFMNTTSELTDGSNIEVEIDASSVNYAVLMGLYAGEVTYEIIKDSVVVFSETKSLRHDDIISGWYAYYFDEIRSAEDDVEGLPIYNSATLRITLTPLENDTVRCGMCAIGKVYDLGKATWGTSVGISDYSRKITDDFGNVYLQEGNYARNADVDFEVYTSQIDFVERIISSVRGKASVWIADNEDIYSSLLIYGYCDDFSISFKGPIMSNGTLSLQGLT